MYKRPQKRKSSGLKLLDQIEEVKDLLSRGIPRKTTAAIVGIAKVLVDLIASGKYQIVNGVLKPLAEPEEYAYWDGKRVHNQLTRSRKSKLKRNLKHRDNLIFSIKYRFRGILAEEAGLSIPPEDRAIEDCY